MDFFKSALSGGSKSDDKSSGVDVADLMSKAQGFLSEKKLEEVEAEETKAAPAKETPKVDEVVSETKESADAEITAPDTTKPVETKDEDTKASETKQPASDVPLETKASYTDLYKSAQTVLTGVQGKLAGKSDVDDKQLADATEDLLKDAGDLGLIKPDSAYSGYFKKAEGFLHSYNSGDAAKKSDESA